MDGQKQDVFNNPYTNNSGQAQTDTQTLKIVLWGFRRLHAAGMARLLHEVDRPVVVRSEEKLLALPAGDLVIVNLQKDTVAEFGRHLSCQPRQQATPVLALYDSSSDAMVRNLMQSNRQVRGVLPTNASVTSLILTIKAILAGKTVDPASAVVKPVALNRPSNSRQASVVDSNGRTIKLTPRQMQVLESLAQGKPNKIIARDLDVSENTIKAHLKSVFRILGASNRTEAVAHANRLNLQIN